MIKFTLLLIKYCALACYIVLTLLISYAGFVQDWDTFYGLSMLALTCGWIVLIQSEVTW